MKQRLIMVLVFVAALALLCTAALASDAPKLFVAADGTVSCEQTGGAALYVAAYDPASGQFRGLVEPGAKLGSGAAELKAFQTDAANAPVSDPAGVLVIAEAGTYRGGSYDTVVIAAGVGSGAVDLKDFDIQGDLCVYAPCDLTLDGTTVAGELRSAAAPSASLLDEGIPSIRIINASGVGSIRIERTADGGIRIRTEEGCDVEWVIVEDGQGEIILEGDYNQVVVETDGEAPVILDGANVSGLTINGENADVTLQGETSVVAVQIDSDAGGAELTVETGSEVVYLQSETGDVTVTGNGTIIDADVPEGATVQPTVPEQPAAHQHTWALGCMSPAAEEQNGEVSYVCTVCGAASAAEVSEKPYAVTIWVGENGDETETVRFDTLDDAIAFAETHSYEVEGDESPIVLCPEIHVVGAAAVGDLTLPKCHTLFVDDGGSLSIIGEILTGSARYDDAGKFYYPAYIVVPVEEGVANRLSVGGQLIYDGGDPDESPIVAEPNELFQDGPHRDLIRIGGAWTDMPEFARSPLILDGALGHGYTCDSNCYRIQKDLDLRDAFVGIQVGSNDHVRIAARVWTDSVWCWGEGGDFYLGDEGAALYLGDYSVGLRDDCNVQIKQHEGQDLPIVGLSDPGYLLFIGGDVVFRGDGLELPGMDFAGMDENDETRYTITVEAGASVRARENLWFYGRQFTLVNRGTLEVMGQLSVQYGELVNDGTILLRAFRAGEDEQGEAWYDFGQLQLWGQDAVMENNGTIRLQSIHYTNSDGWEDGRYAELSVANGATLNNNAGALIENDGFFFVRSGTVNNAGTLRNTESMSVELCDEGWVSYDGGEPVLDQQGGDGALHNSGALINEGWLSFRGTTLESSGSIVNNAQIDMNTGEAAKTVVYVEKREGEPQTDEDWENFRGGADETHWWRRVDEQREVLYEQLPNLYVTGGTLLNGAVTGVGDDFNGSWAEFRLSAGDGEACKALNRGEIVNNGFMSFENVIYTQDAAAKLTTYNSSELQFRGGGIHVPSGAWFRNEGHMRIIDRYGAPFQPCDLNGFEDFFTTWNEDGNDSNWCEFTAEVYDFDGYRQAVDDQSARRAQNPNTCYDRLDFCGDVTFTEDTVFNDFRDYWIQTSAEERWHVWDEAQGDWIDVDGPQDGAESYWIEVGHTLTVAEGVTLTVAQENALRIDGAEGQMVYFSPNRLTVRGTLVTEAGQEGSEENDWDRREEGFVEVWAFGSLDASAGTVVNDGRIEVRYYDMGHGEDENGEFRYVHEGRFERPEECYVLGLTDAVCAAEVRSAVGFLNATASTEPAFYRMYIRNDTCVTLTEDAAVDMGINLEPGSGLIVEHGAALTMNEHFWNDGDVSIYGDLILNGSFDNNQSLEVGALSGSQQAHINLNGNLQLRGHSIFKLYPTGSVVLGNGSELWNEREEPVSVTPAGNPWQARGAVFSEPLELHSESRFERCVFEGPVTLRATPNSSYGFADGCEFREDVTLDAGSGAYALRVNFDGNAVFADGRRVLVTHDANADLDDLLYNSVDLGGANGLTIESGVSMWVNPGWLALEAGESARYVLNGVTVEHRSLYGGAVGGGGSLRFEPRDGAAYRIFQADSDNDTEIALIGTLSGYDELRLMQGVIDISELDTGDTYISIGDCWRYTDVNVGSHAVELWETDEPGDGAGRYGFGITAAAGAEITVHNGVMLWDEAGDCFDYSTFVNVTVGEAATWLNPHVFGTRDDRTPAVYLGGRLDSAVFHLYYDGQELPFTTEYLQDEWNDELHWKTHLNRVEGQPWFEANQSYDPRLVMTVELAEGVTVTFDPVPVKPEWMED